MKNLRNVALAFIVTCTLNAQNEAVSWIDAHAHSLELRNTAFDDLEFLSAEIKDKTVVGLGEASHGTQEFFALKKRLVEYLIDKAGYRLFAIECPKTYLQPVEEYVQGTNPDIKTALQPLGLYNSEEFRELFSWIKTYNEKKAPQDKVHVVGIDDEKFWNDPLERDELMARNLIDLQKERNNKCVLWSHNLHIAKDVTMSNYRAMGFYIKREFGPAYYAIGFDMFEGSVNVLNNSAFESHEFKADAGSLSETFRQSTLKNFFIAFAPETNPLAKAPATITNIYSNWKAPFALPIVPGVDFDAMIFIRNTTASVPAK